MKIILKYLKKIILGAFLLYGYNLIAVTFNITIPINFYTILIVGLFDVFGLISLVTFKFFML